MHIHMHVHMRKLHIRAMELKKGFQKEQGFQGRFKSTDGGRMTDRNVELVPNNWSQVGERALTTGLCSEGWYMCFIAAAFYTEIEYSVAGRL